MLTILLKLLSILGVLLLVLLGVAFAAILLVLFVPVTYRIRADRQAFPEEGADSAQASGKAMHIGVRVNWLLGFVRARFFYPDPGTLTVKVLFFTLFDSGGTKQRAKGSTAKEKPAKEKSAKEKSAKGNPSEESPAKENLAKENLAKGNPSEESPAKENLAKENLSEESTTKESPEKESSEKESTAEERRASGTQKDAGKRPDGERPGSSETNPLEKLQYTFHKICDKIREIHENIAFYREILLGEDARGLVNHAFMRLGRILKSIRPRRLKADIRFGTGSPDTTGYVFGIYGMLRTCLGKQVVVTPDFELACLEGELDAAGHITIFKLLWHGLRVALDKRLWELVGKLKSENN